MHYAAAVGRRIAAKELRIRTMANKRK